MSRARMLDEPGPFARIIAAHARDREMFSHLVYEEALTVSAGLAATLSGRHGRLMSDGELRTAALRLAVTSLTILELLEMTPMNAVKDFAFAEAERIEASAA